MASFQPITSGKGETPLPNVKLFLSSKQLRPIKIRKTGTLKVFLPFSNGVFERTFDGLRRKRIRVEESNEMILSV